MPTTTSFKTFLNSIPYLDEGKIIRLRTAINIRGTEGEFTFKVKSTDPDIVGKVSCDGSVHRLKIRNNRACWRFLRTLESYSPPPDPDDDWVL